VSKRFLRDRVLTDFAFFITWGSHMGLRFKLAQKGDAVIVLFGAQLPFILWPMGEHYSSCINAMSMERRSDGRIESWKIE
jgi:hypothetical protein